MPTIDANGVSLYFESQGNEGDPVILMIMVVGLTVIQFRFIERRVHY